MALLPPEGKAHCSLHSLVQYNCSFEKGLVTCEPFKRVFKDCVLRSGKHRVVEVTEASTNAGTLNGDHHEFSGDCEMGRFKAAQGTVRDINEI